MRIGRIFLLAPANDHVPGDEQGSANPPERGQGFGEDDEPKDGGDHEVRGGVDYGDLGCRGAAGEGFGEESPHLEGGGVSLEAGEVVGKKKRDVLRR